MAEWSRKRHKEVVIEGRPFDIDVRAVSGGARASNSSGLFVNGANLSPDRRGLNIVELRPGRIAYVGNFDTNTDAGAASPGDDADLRTEDDRGLRRREPDGLSVDLRADRRGVGEGRPGGHLSLWKGDEVMRALSLQAPSFDGFDGGSGSRYQSKREIRSFWRLTWLLQPAALVENSKLIEAPPHGASLAEVVAEARNFDLALPRRRPNWRRSAPPSAPGCRS